MRIRGELYATVDEIPDERVQRVIRRTIADMVNMAGGIERFIEDELIEVETQVIHESVFDQSDGTNFSEDEFEYDMADTLILEQPQFEEKAPDPEPPIEEPPSQTPEQKAFLESLQSQSFSAEPEPQTGRDAPSFMSRIRNLTNRQTEESEELLPKLDMAGQINTILQKQLTKMPTLSDRHIELRSTISGELQFMVDGTAYESVNDIPDPEASSAFREAISAWENSPNSGF